MLTFVLNIAFLLVIGLLGLMGSGGLPGANKDANAAAENVAAKLAPFAGIIGVVSLVWGIWGLIGVFSLLDLIAYTPVWVIISIVAVVVLIGLGLILAYPLLAQALAGSGGGKDALEKSLAAVKPLQRPLSLAAVGLAVLYLLLYILARMGIAF
jgi:preprotein translocase subunit SecG